MLICNKKRKERIAMRKIIDAEETLEDMFMQFGCKKVFKNGRQITYTSI